MKSRDRYLRFFAKKLRNGGTNAERLLWRRLQCSQIDGVKFRRQERIECYIVDFVSFQRRIVVELDGSQHQENEPYDRQRDECLRRNGFTVLRFWDNDVMGNIDGVLEVIRQCCSVAASPSPCPPPARGGGTLR